MLVVVQASVVVLQQAPEGGGWVMGIGQKTAAQDVAFSPDIVPVQADRAMTVQVLPLQHAPNCAGHCTTGEQLVPLPP